MYLEERVEYLEKQIEELKEQKKNELYLSPAQFAEKMSCSRSMVTKLVQNGEIEALRLGKLIRIPMSQFEEKEGSKEASWKMLCSKEHKVPEDRRYKMNQAKHELINDKLATAVVKAKTGRSKAGDGTTARAFLEVAAIYLDEITEAIGTVNTLSEAIAVAVLRYLNRTITKEMDEEDKHIADTVEGMLNEQAVTIRTKIMK